MFLCCRDENGIFVEHQLLLGTHTSDEETNHLYIAKIKLPAENTPVDQRQYNEEEFGMFAILCITQTIEGRAVVFLKAM